MTKKHLLIFAESLATTLHLHAQTEVPTTTAIFRNYSTQKWLQQVRQEPRESPHVRRLDTIGSPVTHREG